MEVSIGKGQSINATLDKSSGASVSIGGTKIVYKTPDRYKGDYEVVPLNAPQTLPTKDKFLIDDVRVHSVPYLERPLESGGIEITIGG